MPFQARENKFVVRDFQYNPDELQAGKSELTKLATDKKKQFGPLVRKRKCRSRKVHYRWMGRSFKLRRLNALL